MARGVSESVKTQAGNRFSKQVLKSGQTVYRKNGRFTSARAFRGAIGARQSVRVPGYVSRTPTPTDFRPRRIDFVKRDGTAGADAARILPYLRPGDPITKAEADILFQEFRMERSFLGFWDRLGDGRGNFPSRAEASEQFLRFMRALEAAHNAMERNEVRIAFLGAGTNLETIPSEFFDQEEAA